VGTCRGNRPLVGAALHARLANGALTLVTPREVGSNLLVMVMRQHGGHVQVFIASITEAAWTGGHDRGCIGACCSFEQSTGPLVLLHYLEGWLVDTHCIRDQIHNGNEIWNGG